MNNGRLPKQQHYRSPRRGQTLVVGVSDDPAETGADGGGGAHSSSSSIKEEGREERRIKKGL